MSGTGLLILCQHLTSTWVGSNLAICLSAMAVARSKRPTTAVTSTQSFCVVSLPTPTKEIVLLLEVMREEETKRTVLAISRNRPYIFDHPRGKFIVLLFEYVFVYFLCFVYLFNFKVLKCKVSKKLFFWNVSTYNHLNRNHYISNSMLVCK